MKTYSIDYTKISEAENKLYSATRLLANDCRGAAVERITEARRLLLEFLNGDNLVEDNDLADGLVKQLETFGDFQLNFIRYVFSGLLKIAEKKDMKRIELDIINVCQKQLGADEYESIEQFYRVNFFEFD